MPPPELAMTNCRVWLDWAATQIEGSLASDSAECDRLIAGLAEMLRAAERRSSAEPRSESVDESVDESVGQKMSRVVVAVQSHDRFMQQLSHVAQALRGLHEYLGNPGLGTSPDGWRDLGTRQLRAFSMPEERVLFSDMVGLRTGAVSDPYHGAPGEDAVELFA